MTTNEFKSKIDQLLRLKGIKIDNKDNRIILYRTSIKYGKAFNFNQLEDVISYLEDLPDITEHQPTVQTDYQVMETVFSKVERPKVDYRYIPTISAEDFLGKLTEEKRLELANFTCGALWNKICSQIDFDSEVHNEIYKILWETYRKKELEAIIDDIGSSKQLQVQHDYTSTPFDLQRAGDVYDVFPK